MKLTIGQRVGRGAAYLDLHKPGWFRMLRLELLDLASCCRCVIGQLYGDYEDVLRILPESRSLDKWDQEEWGHDNGFGSVAEDPEDFDRLTVAWIEEVRARLKDDKENPSTYPIAHKE